MRVTTAFNRMLGLPGAWVRDVAFGAEAMIVTVVLRAEKPVCSGCGPRGLPIKEHREKRWRSLDLGAPRCVVECRLRRLYCPGCGDVYEAVPWARAGSRHTRDFEDLTAWLAQQMSQRCSTVPRLMRIGWQTVGNILARVVAERLKVFDAPTTSDRERKQLLRAILTDVVVTVDRESEQHAAQLRAVWEGGAVTEHTVTLPRTGSHTRCTDQDTIALVRQLAEHYPDKQIAAILSRQGRRTGAGNPFTAHNVHGLRTYHKIPAAPVRPTAHDGDMVTIAKAANDLGVSTATVHRWLREGFITGEQITPGAPWQIQLTDELRQRIRPQAPDGWLPLTQAANALGVARQTVLHKVQRGELAAVYVHNGKRKGLRIQVKPDQTGLFDNHIRQEAQC